MNEIFHDAKNLTSPGEAADPCQALLPCPMLTQCHLYLIENFTAGLVSKHKARKMLPCQLIHSFWMTAGVQALFIQY